MIPAQPKFQVEKITPHSAVLTWKIVKYSYYSDSDGLSYEVRLQPEAENWKNLSNNDFKVSRSNADYSIHLTHLPYAYYNYTVSLRLRINSAKDKAIWSEPFVREFQTLAKLPDNPPATDVSSFYVDSQQQKVTLYWRQLLRPHHNGPNFTYIFTQIKKDDKIITK